jgi:hypothetical protein
MLLCFGLLADRPMAFQWLQQTNVLVVLLEHMQLQVNICRKFLCLPTLSPLRSDAASVRILNSFSIVHESAL